jgi:hypothetical protein
MLALIQAKRFVDAHSGAEPGGFCQLLQLRVKFAFPIAGAGRARRIGGTDVVADKQMTLKRGQVVFLLKWAVAAGRFGFALIPD